jgi:hypothetical protein
LEAEDKSIDELIYGDCEEDTENGSVEDDAYQHALIIIIFIFNFSRKRCICVRSDASSGRLLSSHIQHVQTQRPNYLAILTYAF